MEKRQTLIITAVLAVVGLFSGGPVKAGENAGSILQGTYSHDAVVTVYINESRTSGGWNGSYVVEMKDTRRSGVDYLYLSSFGALVDHAAEAVIPIDGSVKTTHGEFFLWDSGKDPNGLHYLGPYGAPPTPPGSTTVPSFGSLNAFLTGLQNGNENTRLFTVLLTIVDRRPYDYYPYPYNYSITYGFGDYVNHLIISE